MTIRIDLCLASAIAALVIDSGVAAAPPSVKLTPKIGPPTASISVSGSGFGANAAVDIYFDTTDLCLSIATTAGAIQCTIDAPKDAQPQTHYVSAVQRNTGTGAQAPFLIRTDWAQFHGMNAKHTGFNPYENTIDTSNVRNLDVLWMASIGSAGTTSTPAVVAGRVYISSSDGKVFSFSNETGAAFSGWPKILGGPVQNSSPAVGGNIVYASTIAPDDKLYAFNAVSGVAIAGFPVTLGGNIYASPTLFGGNVYVACYDGKIYAFNAATAVPVAGFPITVGAGNSLDATVTAAYGRIFEGSADDKFYSFDAATGAAISGFPTTTTGFVESTANAVSGQVFFGSDDHSLYGVRRNGASLSGFPVSTAGVLVSSPAIGDGQVIVGSADAKAYDFDAGTGTLNWSRGLDAIVFGSPIIANGVVYVNSASSLYALNETDGKILWRASVPASVSLASPVVADGIVYLGSTDGNLYAFSVNGMLPSSLLSGGRRGTKPAIPSLIPDYSLKPHKTQLYDGRS